MADTPVVAGGNDINALKDEIVALGDLAAVLLELKRKGFTLANFLGEINDPRVVNAAKVFFGETGEVVTEVKTLTLNEGLELLPTLITVGKNIVSAMQTPAPAAPAA